MRIVFLVFICIAICFTAFSQEEESDTTNYEYFEEPVIDEEALFDSLSNATTFSFDSTSDNTGDLDGLVSPDATDALKNYRGEDVNTRKLDEDRWKEVIGDAEFSENKLKKPKEYRGWKAPFTINPAVVKAVAYAVIIGLLAFILYYVVANTGFSIGSKKIRKKVDYQAPVEDIDEFDSDGMLQAALAGGDLRLAIRAHYLLLLRKLNEAGLIKWKKDKTNRDYLFELYGRNDCYNDVQKRTLVYELVWYGERSVSPESYQRISGDFESVARVVTPIQPATS